jgi:hypothetical protein
MDTKDKFDSDRYVTVNNFLDKDICNILAQSTFYSMINNGNCGDNQVPNAVYKEYANPVIESLLLYCKPKIEHLTGMELAPTYSYFRIYKPGDVLERHTDRPSCEVSATVTLAFLSKEPVDPWAIYFKKVDGNEVRVVLNPGDATIYRGRELEHWREPFEGGESCFQVQAFLHYVDKNGQFYPMFENDQRPKIGIKKTSFSIQNYVRQGDIPNCFDNDTILH